MARGQQLRAPKSTWKALTPSQLGRQSLSRGNKLTRGCQGGRCLIQQDCIIIKGDVWLHRHTWKNSTGKGWLSTGLRRRDASGGTNPTLLTPGSRTPSLSSHENTYSCYSRLVPLPRPTALVCLLQQPELIPQPCGCTNTEVTWEPGQHSLEPPRDQASITETTVPEGGKDGCSPWDTRACCPQVAAWGRSGKAGGPVAPGSDGAAGQAGALDHSRPRPVGPWQGTDA